MTPIGQEGAFRAFAPIVRALGGGDFQLMEPIRVRLIGGVRPYDLIVPAGFVTDFASIPSAAHWFVDPSHAAIMRAAIAHDWCYSSHVTSRQVADSVFYSIMRQDGMPRLRAKVCFRAVNLFGKRGYDAVSPARFRERTPGLYRRHYCAAPAYEVGNTPNSQSADFRVA